MWKLEMEGIIKWPCEAMSDWLSQVWTRWFVYVCFQKSVEEGFCNIWDMMLMKQVSLGLHMVIHSSKYFLHVMYTSAIVLIATQWLMGSQACSKTLEVQWDYDDKNTLTITFRMFFFAMGLSNLLHTYLRDGVLFKMFIDALTSQYNQHGTSWHQNSLPK